MPSKSISEKRYNQLRDLNIWDKTDKLSQTDTDNIFRILFPIPSSRMRTHTTTRMLLFEIELVCKWFSPEFNLPLSDIQLYRRCDPLMLIQTLENLGFETKTLDGTTFVNVSSIDKQILTGIMIYDFHIWNHPSYKYHR